MSDGQGRTQQSRSSNDATVAAHGFPLLICPRCGRSSTGFAGCGPCATAGVAVNLVMSPANLTGRELGSFRGGPWGWPGTLPFTAGDLAVTLGEGDTPLIADPSNDGLLLKLETQNPTGSHKDRAMSVGVTAARLASCDVVVAASSGNAGAAAAAYAARAGLRAIVTTTAAIPSATRAQIVAAGATLAIYSSASASSQARRGCGRWRCVAVGSHGARVGPGLGGRFRSTPVRL